MEKVNELIKREIGLILQQEMTDPRLAFVTVTAVSVSPDLRYARVRYTVLGGAGQVEAAAAALSHARGYIRRLVGRRVTIRYLPEIDFEFDRSVEYSIRMEQTLGGLCGDGEKPPPPAGKEDGGET